MFPASLSWPPDEEGLSYSGLTESGSAITGVTKINGGARNEGENLRNGVWRSGPKRDEIVEFWV